MCGGSFSKGANDTKAEEEVRGGCRRVCKTCKRRKKEGKKTLALLQREGQSSEKHNKNKNMEIKS